MKEECNRETHMLEMRASDRRLQFLKLKAAELHIPQWPVFTALLSSVHILLTPAFLFHTLSLNAFVSFSSPPKANAN
jgi:hypothetical protein